MSLTVAFRRFSAAFNRAMALPAVFIGHVAAIIVWLCFGPAFAWSTGWNFVGNQAISIDTLLVGLLILSASQRESDIQDAKTDVIIEALPGAPKDLIGSQNRPEQDLPTT